MRRKSKHEELRARAFGSEMDNEAEASKDILCGGEGVSIGMFSGGEEEVLIEDVRLVCRGGCQLEGSLRAVVHSNLGSTVVSQESWRIARVPPLPTPNTVISYKL
jgi:hypothetical protein